MNIYVGNLAYSVTEEILRESFEQYGAVRTVNVMKDKFSGQSKGFGFVEMPNNSEADAAIKGLNDTPINGRVVRVNQAKPRPDRAPQRRPGGGAGGGRRY